MTFTAVDIIAFSTLIGVIFTGIAGIISAFRLGKVEAHVNSAATAATGVNTSLQKQNDMLRETVAKLEQGAALLAQTAAERIRVEGEFKMKVPAPMMEAVLKHVDTTTDEDTVRTKEP